jgi:hypothetical protein
VVNQVLSLDFCVNASVSTPSLTQPTEIEKPSLPLASSGLAYISYLSTDHQWYFHSQFGVCGHLCPHNLDHRIWGKDLLPLLSGWEQNGCGEVLTYD